MWVTDLRGAVLSYADRDRATAAAEIWTTASVRSYDGEWAVWVETPSLAGDA